MSSTAEPSVIRTEIGRIIVSTPLLSSPRVDQDRGEVLDDAANLSPAIVERSTVRLT